MRLPPWVFTTVYLTFGALVLLTFWFVPMQWPTARTLSCFEFRSTKFGLMIYFP